MTLTSEVTICDLEVTKSDPRWLTLLSSNFVCPFVHSLVTWWTSDMTTWWHFDIMTTWQHYDIMTGSFADDWPYGIFIIFILQLHFFSLLLKSNWNIFNAYCYLYYISIRFSTCNNIYISVKYRVKERESVY